MLCLCELSTSFASGKKKRRLSSTKKNGLKIHQLNQNNDGFYTVDQPNDLDRKKIKTKRRKDMANILLLSVELNKAKVSIFSSQFEIIGDEFQ